MTQPLQIEYVMSHAAPPDDNFLRMIFTFFLNTGAFDDRMRKAAQLEAKSANARHMGDAFIRLHQKEILQEFLVWVKTDNLARYIMSNQDMAESLVSRFKIAGCCPPIDNVFGIRYKEISGFGRARLPKDLKKSFLTKASNRLIKFVDQLRAYASDEVVRQVSGPLRGAPKNRDPKAWLKFALSEKARDLYIWSTHLRQIRNLYWKTIAANEPLDGVIRELLDLAQVADVMRS